MSYPIIAAMNHPAVKDRVLLTVAQNRDRQADVDLTREEAVKLISDVAAALSKL